jgi:transposase-like protein
MVQEISPEDRRRVVDLWLQGSSYKAIESEVGIPISAISSIIREERKKVPDADQLRELNAGLKETKAALPEALRGAHFLKKLNNLNIKLKDVETCTRLLAKYGEGAGRVLEAADRLSGLEESQGKPYGEIVAEAEAMARSQQAKDVRG